MNKIVYECLHDHNEYTVYADMELIGSFELHESGEYYNVVDCFEDYSSATTVPEAFGHIVVKFEEKLAL